MKGSTEMILVCVTEQESSIRLIRAGHKLADRTDLDLKVICVRPRHMENWLASEEVEILFSEAKQLNAEMIVKFHDNAAKAVLEYIQEQPVQAVIVGSPPDQGHSGFIARLKQNCPETPVIIIDSKGKPKQSVALNDAALS